MKVVVLMEAVDLKEIRKKVHKLSYELWRNLDTLEEASVLHDNEEYCNSNELKLYDALERFLKAEGVFTSNNLNKK
ncbi:TPA: hypothetical protein QCV86_005101 [Bacillus thuringiensis]|nr:hypothetical protein [Bacillus thuringiensis]HDR6834366.1 hypothetical protein [Bacillus thuringiensis]HDR6860242.1 hypothetical protein [Bacillus thuringiensis]HDR6906068.1 hypothetical protein [Bacillus thuringiensis]HDR6911697.1 hypothetical protein [Bacillus thuringiensis]